MQFSAVAVEEVGLAYQVIEEDVVGEACPGKGDQLSSYERALELALGKAPGANALINVQFERAERIGEICVRVTGDAVRQ